jgi:hypothetical protein
VSREGREGREGKGGHNCWSEPETGSLLDWQCGFEGTSREDRKGREGETAATTMPPGAAERGIAGWSSFPCNTPTAAEREESGASAVLPVVLRANQESVDDSRNAILQAHFVKINQKSKLHRINRT